MPLNRIYRLALVLTLCLSATVVAYADCQADYSDAMDKLAKAKAQALDPNEAKLNPQAFMQDFQGDMNRLQSGQCTAQIMQLLQYVQQEATQYPAPAGALPGSNPAAGGARAP